MAKTEVLNTQNSHRFYHAVHSNAKNFDIGGSRFRSKLADLTNGRPYQIHLHEMRRQIVSPAEIEMLQLTQQIAGTIKDGKTREAYVSLATMPPLSKLLNLVDISCAGNTSGFFQSSMFLEDGHTTETFVSLNFGVGLRLYFNSIPRLPDTSVHIVVAKISSPNQQRGLGF